MIGVLGISYKTAPIDKREIFSFSKDEIVPFADFLAKETGISDLVLLSTCNRTELYFTQSKYDRLTAIEKVTEAFKNYKNADHECSRFLYHKFDLNAVKHLFRVAAGLESMIIGEDQIIGQIKDAYIHCTDAGLTDAVLMRLFQKSFEAGKRARTETGIKLGNLSVSSIAVEMCVQKIENMKEKSLLVVGTGNTGSLALQNMVKKGIGKTAVINRTKKSAQIVADRFNSEVHSFLSLQSQLLNHDIIIVATGAPHHLITKNMVKKAQANTNRSQIYIDLSVPRNIDESISKLPNVKLFAVDDLQIIVDENTEKRKDAAEIAEVIISELAEAFNDWVVSRSLRPAIKTISDNLEEVYRQELENFKHIESNEIKKAVDSYTKHITQRYTRLLIKNLKEITDNGRNTDSLNVINEMFKLEENNRRKH
ncbi:MAG: glutamyl-tRNA reductase [Prolixibacteraceae bacterium]|jgi:glutamyl-tRNA reductase|nr:glutamyl-tRNA reductase [Prolixibacteraceae bacterium]